MTALVRGFLAVVPPVPVLDAVEGLLERSRSSRFQWSRRGQWHVTMQFYGRVGDGDALADEIERVGATRPPVRLALRGGGAFPVPKRARVLWLGVDDGDALAALHESVLAATGRFVDRRDRTPFHPHLTLARLRSTTDLTDDVAVLEGVPVGPPWTADELVLMESETRRGPAVHSVVRRLPLGG